jgi:uncharacterized membrane protein YhhN
MAIVGSHVGERRAGGPILRKDHPMTTGAWILLAVAAVAAVGDWVAVNRGDGSRLEYVCKPLATAALIGVAATIDPTSDEQRWWFVAALVLSLIGDVALMLPSDRFVIGLGAFLAAHIAYVVGFATLGGSAADYLIGLAVVAAAIVPLAARFVGALRRAGAKELVVPVVLYIAAIAAMVASAIAVGNAVAIVGAILFMVSDSLIAETRFVGPRPHGRVAIMVTYHLAQAALVLSLLP